jgi:hypothetical protein
LWNVCASRLYFMADIVYLYAMVIIICIAIVFLYAIVLFSGPILK